MAGAGAQPSIVVRLRRFLFHKSFLLTRGMTLGTRALVLDGDGKVFLIRHTYVPGWQLPGGGVEVGETLRQSLERELAEEGNIEITGEPRLLGVYFNGHVSRRDHVAVYVVRDFRQTAPRPPDREIAASGFFPADALPPDTTRGTRDRIREALGLRAVTAHW
jgi:ADP-ribose pyrophosphatase YjhB (NUDIX family)